MLSRSNMIGSWAGFSPWGNQIHENVWDESRSLVEEKRATTKWSSKHGIPHLQETTHMALWSLQDGYHGIILLPGSSMSRLVKLRFFVAKWPRPKIKEQIEQKYKTTTSKVLVDIVATDMHPIIKAPRNPGKIFQGASIPLVPHRWWWPRSRTQLLLGLW